ncbi:MAG: glucan biosynthesis protein G [Desulfobacterales bacterium]
MLAARVLRNCLRFNLADGRAKLPFLMIIVSILTNPLGGTVGTLCAADGTAYFDAVIARAEQMAHKPYQPPEPVPQYLDRLTFDQWQNIVFREDRSPWPADNNFVLQFYHIGYLYKQPVKIYTIDSQGIHEFPFSSKLFSYGDLKPPEEMPEDLGFAGFSLYYPLVQTEARNEFLVFIGTTYFRAVGKGQWFGLSARGIAIDTASPQGEQFPYFKAFWLARPAAKADSIRIYALLDGQSVTGAYQFEIYPGDQTVMDVESVLFLRKKVEKLGIAPFSSMFLQGSNSTRRYNTLSPQMHDSDGLSIQTRDNRWIWCPLQNPQQLAVQDFQLENPQGFGLMQRDRRFCSYESLAQHYQDRPSAWLTPAGSWKKGSLQLFEIPTDTENNDNIVVFWMPDESYELLQPIRFGYRISWQGDDTMRPSIGYVVNTRTGPGIMKKNSRTFEIDFAGGSLGRLSSDAVSAVVSVEKGAKLLEHHIVKNEFVKGMRLELQIEPPEKPVRLEAFLQAGDEAITETWSYVFHPD